MAARTAPAPPVVERSEPFPIGHGHVYRNGKPSAVWVTVDGDPFVEVRGALYKPCGRCPASSPGVIPEYGGIHDGVCFECRGWGHGKHVGTVEQAAKIVRQRNRRREREAAKREAEAQRVASEHEAWREANAELVAMLDPIAEGWATVKRTALTESAIDTYVRRYGRFLIDMAEQAQYRALSPAQAQAAVEAAERAHAWAAEHEARAAVARYLGAEGEKVTVTGTVTVWTTVEDHYSRHGGSKALVVVTGEGDDDGVTLKMLGTGATLWECNKGDKVSVTGTVKRHGEYQGVKQTEVTRAKVTVLVPHEESESA